MSRRTTCTHDISALVFCFTAVCASDAAHAEPQPGEIFRDCADCPEMIVLPAGRFRIGSLPEQEPERGQDEAPVQEVTIPASFAMSRYEVTRGQYKIFLAETGYPVGGNCITDRRNPYDWKPDPETNLHDPGFVQADDHPVVCVNAIEAEAYAAWLSKRTGMQYRLPTEVEWEYAARGGTTTAYFWGDNVDDGCSYMNGTDETAFAKYPKIPHMRCSDGALNTAPVGSYRANGFGLYDITGNVGEWTSSCATPDYAHLANSGSVADCTRRMVRGGSWGTIPRQQRVAERIRYAITDRDDSLGIRLARDLTDQAASNAAKH